MCVLFLLQVSLVGVKCTNQHTRIFMKHPTWLALERPLSYEMAIQTGSPMKIGITVAGY